MNFLSSYSKSFESILLNIGVNLKSYSVFKLSEEKKLSAAISYAYANGGKRLRPVLALLSAEAILSKGKKIDELTDSGDLEQRLSMNPAMGLALAVELVHCGSLVHDDLPCMDNDALRRGKPTNHIVYGEDIALLAGDFLLVNPSLVFIEYSTEVLKLDEKLILKVLSRFNSAIQEMIVGQALDLELARENLEFQRNHGGNPDAEQRITYFEKSRLMQEFKTGALLSTSITNGALLASANNNELKALEKYAANLGLAFQIVDDILDYTSTPELMGKQTQKDAKQNKLTYVDLYGIAGAKQKASELILEAKEILSASEIYSDKLKLVADYVLHRNN